MSNFAAQKRLELRIKKKYYYSSILVGIVLMVSALPLFGAEPDYFTLTNTGSSSVNIQLRRQGGNYTTNNINLSYSLNGATWTDEITYGTASTDGLTITLSAGQNVRFRGYNLKNSTFIFGKGSSTYWYFSLPTTTTYSVSGELMSLVSYKDGALHTDEYPLGSYCFEQLFKSCTTLTDASTLKLSAMKLGTYCYEKMFNGCSALTNAPALPATELTSYCYSYMFGSCTSIISAPALPAMTLGTYCYYGMFSGCKALTTAPYLGATQLEEGCYGYMFQNCSTLVNVQDTLPGLNMPKFCYQYMFNKCIALKNAPEIMAEASTLPGQGACDNMFAECSNLETAPSHLYPTTLSYNMTYSHMFYKCSKLKVGPDIHATTISSSNPLQYMYMTAPDLQHIRVYFTKWGKLSWCNYWTSGVANSGAFYCPPELARTYNSTQTTPAYIPDNWTIFSYNLTYIPVGGNWPDGTNTNQQFTWKTDTSDVQGFMRGLKEAEVVIGYYHDEACTQPFTEAEIIAFMATQQETSSDITKKIYVKLGTTAPVEITFEDYNGSQLAKIEVAKGTIPVYPNATPKPHADDTTIYIFSGWTPTIVAATANTTYTATYTTTTRYEYVSYPLKDEDKTPDMECVEK